MRKDIEKLILHIEPQIVGILLSHGLITAKKKKFSNIIITQKGKAVLNITDPLITTEWIKKWQMLWPLGFRGNTSVVREKLNNFLSEYDFPLDEIFKATEKWLIDRKSPYCGNSRYFFSKIEDGTKISRCLEYLELNKDQENNYYDNTTIMTDEDN